MVVAGFTRIITNVMLSTITAEDKFGPMRHVSLDALFLSGCEFHSPAQSLTHPVADSYWNYFFCLASHANLIYIHLDFNVTYHSVLWIASIPIICVIFAPVS